MQESRRKDIRRTAAVVREKCKVSRYGIIDLFKECARLGYKLIRCLLYTSPSPRDTR